MTPHSIIKVFLSATFTHQTTPLSDRMISREECVFLFSLNFSRFSYLEQPPQHSASPAPAPS